jgi:hypothetical protein
MASANCLANGVDHFLSGSSSKLRRRGVVDKPLTPSVAALKLKLCEALGANALDCRKLRPAALNSARGRMDLIVSDSSRRLYFSIATLAIDKRWWWAGEKQNVEGWGLSRCSQSLDLMKLSNNQP